MPPQFENNAPQTTAREIKPKKRYGFLITLTAIMLISGGYALWYLSNLPPEPVEETIASKTDKFNDWKTYRNEELGFELKYPSDFIAYTGFKGEELVEISTTSTKFWITQNNGRLRTGEPMTLRIELINTTLTPKEWLEKNKEKYSHPTEIKYIKDSSLFRKNGVEMEGGCNLGSVCKVYIFTIGHNYLIAITKDDKAIFDKILSTFKFISTSTQETINTSGWKTYTNNSHGFSFSYPSNLYYQEFSDILFGENRLQLNFYNDKSNLRSVFSIRINDTFGLEGCDQEPLKETKNIGGVKMIRNNLCGQIFYENDTKNFYVINWEYEIKNFDQILSTFKFTK